MTLIEILLSLRYMSYQGREEELDSLSIYDEQLRNLIQDSFDGDGNLVDSKGYVISLYLSGFNG